ncbi:MAG: hypothetical protein ACLF0P_02470 [Thermoanaerobaculia bacterium]
MWTDPHPVGAGPHVARVAGLVGILLLACVPLSAQEGEEAPAEGEAGAGGSPTPQAPVGVEEGPGEAEEPEDTGDAGERGPFDEAEPRGFEAPFGDRTFLSSSLAVSTGRDLGFQARGEELDDTVHRVTPRLLWRLRPSPRSELAVGYAPELEYFEQNDDLDAVHHVAGARFSHELTRRSRVTGGASLLDGEDPSRHLGGAVLLVLPRVPYQRTRARAGFEHRWKRTSFFLELARTDTEIDPSPGRLLAFGLDRSENTATVSLRRRVTPRLGLSGSYSYVDASDAAPAVGPGDVAAEEVDAFQTAILGVDYSVTPRLDLDVSGGVLEDDDGELSYIGRAGIRRTGRNFGFRLGYDRSLLSLGTTGETAGADGAVPPTAAVRDTVSQTVTVAVLARLGGRVRWEQLARGTRSSLPDEEDLETLAASSRLVVEVTRRIGAFAQVDYLDQQGSEALGAAFSRVDFTAGLIVGLTGPSGSWGVTRPQRELETVLPYDARRY